MENQNNPIFSEGIAAMAKRFSAQGTPISFGNKPLTTAEFDEFIRLLQAELPPSKYRTYTFGPVTNQQQNEIMIIDYCCDKSRNSFPI